MGVQSEHFDVLPIEVRQAIASTGDLEWPSEATVRALGCAFDQNTRQITTLSTSVPHALVQPAGLSARYRKEAIGTGAVPEARSQAAAVIRTMMRTLRAETVKNTHIVTLDVIRGLPDDLYKDVLKGWVTFNDNRADCREVLACTSGSATAAYGFDGQAVQLFHEDPAGDPHVFVSSTVDEAIGEGGQFFPAGSSEAQDYAARFSEFGRFAMSAAISSIWYQGALVRHP